MWKKHSVSALLLAGGLLAGCAEEPAQQEETGQDEKTGIEIGMTFDSFIIERWQRDRDVFVSAAQELGAEVNVQNANGDLEEQLSQIEYFIEKDVDAIVIVAIDSNGLAEAVAEAHRAGIPVIAYDRLIRNANVDLYISFDNEEVGRLMGEHIREHLGETGQVLQICGRWPTTMCRWLCRAFRMRWREAPWRLWEQSMRRDGWRKRVLAL